MTDEYFCTFERADHLAKPHYPDGAWQCSKCGYVSPANAIRQCGKGPPKATRMAWNLANSIKDFVADGLRTVDSEEYERRLKICDSCDRRDGNRCMECGCFLALKAKGRVFECPIGKWKKG